MDDIYIPKKIESSSVNILSREFYENLIYDGPPSTRSEEPTFKLFAAQMGLEFAICWALDQCDVRLVDYIENPSSKVINKAISLNTCLYSRYKDQLSEDNLIEIVKISGNRYWYLNGWSLLHKLDPQPLSVIKAAIDTDPSALSAVKEQTPGICEYAFFHRCFSEHRMEHLKCVTEKIENGILEKVRNESWSLKYLSSRLMTRDILEKILVQDYDANLQHVIGKRDDLIDDSLIELIIMNEKTRNFPYILDHFKTIERCRRFVKLQSSNLQYVPNKYQFHEIIDESFVNDSAVYEHIKNANVTRALAKMIASFNKNPRKKRFDFINNCSEDEIMELLRYYPQIYSKLSSKNKTIHVTQYAVTLSGWNLQYVPDQQYNDQIYDLAIASEPKAAKYKRV